MGAPIGNKHCLGRKLSDATRKQMSKSAQGKHGGELSGRWKGGLYIYYHERARELFGKPCCEECGIILEEYSLSHKKKKFEMHCVSKDFRILEQWNWKCLCARCHLFIERNDQ